MSSASGAWAPVGALLCSLVLGGAGVRAQAAPCEATLREDVQAILRLRNPGAPESKGEADQRFALALVLHDFSMLARSGAMRADLPSSLSDLSERRLRELRETGAANPAICAIVDFVHGYYAGSRPEALLARSPRAPQQDPTAPQSLAGDATPQAPRRRPSRLAPDEPGTPRARAGAEGPATPQSPPRTATALARTAEESRESLVESSAGRSPGVGLAIAIEGAERSRARRVRAERRRASVARAQQTVQSIRAALAAPPYLTRQRMRLDPTPRTALEVNRMRQETLAARERLLELLLQLRDSPDSWQAVRNWLGPDGCARIQRQIDRLFEGGPGSGDLAKALALWQGRSPVEPP